MWNVWRLNDCLQESPNLLVMSFSESQMASLTYPSEMVWIESDDVIDDDLLCTNGRLSSFNLKMPIVSRFTFKRNERRTWELIEFAIEWKDKCFMKSSVWGSPEHEQVLTKGGFSRILRQLLSSVGEFPSSELVVEGVFT